MDRRKAIKLTSYYLGGALSAPAIAGILQGCKAEPKLNWQPQFFTPDQANLVNQIAELILPKSDTPGASELGVPAFVDEMMAKCYGQNDQSTFTKGLQVLEAKAQQEFGEEFLDCSQEQQYQLLEPLNQEAAQLARRRSPEKPFFSIMKELTLLGYFTTETGASKVLQYHNIPSTYEGCAPLDELGGKAWADGG